jgi:ubiquinone/menaquinone biosynthesis C-methylase UbiE
MRKLINMAKQWDYVAQLNPFFGVTSWREFEKLDSLSLELFWKSGCDDVDRFIRKIGLVGTQNLTMLELGCGVGRMTHRFSELFKYVYAIDVSQEMLSLARKFWGHLENVEFILGNGRDLKPISDSTVDFLFSYLVLQHVLYVQIVLNYIK